MNTRIISTTSEFQAMKDDWDRLHREMEGTIFQSFLWNRTWWEIYGLKFELSLVVVEDASGIAGILPLFKEKTAFGPLHITRLRLLGTRFIYGEYAPLVRPSRKHEAMKHLGSFCARAVLSRSVDLVELYRLPMDDPMTKLFFETLKETGIRARYKRHVIPRVVMELPATWEAYLERLPNTERTMLQRRQRALKKAGAEIETIRDVQFLGNAFDEFVALHRASWNTRGHKGYFEGLEGFEAFHRKVIDVAVREKNGRLYFFTNGGRRFAGVQAFAVHDQVCFYLSGLDRQHPLSRFSPGKVLLAKAIQDAITEGYSEFDFQGGDEHYKHQLGGDRTWFSRITITRPGGGGIGARLFLVVQLIRNFTVNAVLDERLFPFLRRMFGMLRSG